MAVPRSGGAAGLLTRRALCVWLCAAAAREKNGDADGPRPRLSFLPLSYSTATLPRSENYHLRLERAVAYRLARHRVGRSPFRCTRRFRGKTLTPTNKAAAPYMQAPCAHSWDRIVRCEPSSWPISHGPWMLGDVRKGLAHLRRERFQAELLLLVLGHVDPLNKGVPVLPLLHNKLQLWVGGRKGNELVAQVLSDASAASRAFAIANHQGAKLPNTPCRHLAHAS
eukprot:scaffold13392_cov71-Phaeocystis_antarctica.AAC.5